MRSFGGVCLSRLSSISFNIQTSPAESSVNLILNFLYSFFFGSPLEKTTIDPLDTSGSLHDRLAGMGGNLVLTTMEGMLNGQLTPKPQDHSKATYAPMLKKADGHIDWSLPVSHIFCLMRGVTPWPGAFTFHNDMRLKIHRAHPILEPVSEPPGTVLKTFPGELRISTGNGVLQVLEIQGASGKRLAVQDFLRGYRLDPGERLS